VVDVGAIAQLIQQLAKMEQAIQTAENQLNQAQAQYQSMTGQRGMQNLLSGVNRNYLVSDFNQLASALAPGIQSHITTNAVLTPTQVAALSLSEQQQLTNARTNSALLQTASQQGLCERERAVCLDPAIDQRHPGRDRSEGDLGASVTHLGRERDAPEREHEIERLVSGRPGAGVGAAPERERADRRECGEPAHARPGAAALRV